MQFIVDQPFGPPPPFYPVTVKAVRINGAIQTGAAAKGLPSAMTLDITVETLSGSLELQGVKNSFPADPDVDLTGENLPGERGFLFYRPEDRSISLFVFIPSDSIDCADL